MTAAFTVSFVWEDSMSDTGLGIFILLRRPRIRESPLPIVSTTAVRSCSSLMRRHSSLKPGGMVTTAPGFARHDWRRGAGGRFFGAMSDVLRTAQSASTPRVA